MQQTHLPLPPFPHLTFPPHQFLETLREAGALVKERLKTNFSHQLKPDGSPVSEIDKAVDVYLKIKLPDIFPAPYHSEESPLLYEKRKNCSGYWLADPIDGTKELLEGSGEFTVTAAFIQKVGENHMPTLGALFAPVLDEFYWACLGQGAYLWKGHKQLRLPLTQKKKLSFLLSRFHGRKLAEHFFSLNTDKFSEKQVLGSNLKLGRVAQNQGTVYLRFGRSYEWDICSGHLLLSEAGASLVSLQSNPITYNTPDSTVPSFAALPPGITLSHFKLPE